MLTSMRRVLLACLVSAVAFPALATNVLAVELDPSIPAAIAADYDGNDLRVREDLGSTSAYTRHAITYRSGDLTITGVLNKPRGKGPFPVVVLAHGHIEPSVYVTGQGFNREQDWLARHGYVALHVDYRNHAGSDNDPASETSLRIGYAADVINAGLAVRRTIIPWIDNTRVAVLGRSMGGGVAFQALVIRPEVFDAAITYASTSSNVADNFNMWQRGDNAASRAIISRYGTPEGNPAAWARMSSRSYFSRVTEPVLMIHGTRDESCDIEWARATRDALKAAGKDVRLVEYRGAGHYMYGPWQDSITQVDRFLRKHLGT
ncbi:MAG: alpha/beta fold hydrolase [bacterium]|nr:alpha/beta fold hydrolase [bacterium]